MQTDEQVLTPWRFVEQVRQALPGSTEEEGNRLIQHAKAWAVEYYQGDCPPSIEQVLEQLEGLKWH